MRKENVEISAEAPLLLKMHRREGNMERLGIRNEYEPTETAKTIFQSLAVMYLVSPYLPRKITTDFYVPLVFQELIGAMYEHENHDSPKFVLTDKNLLKAKEPVFKNEKNVDKSRTVLTYSGGKDSMWNLDWLSRNLGMKNVLSVHFGNMNRVAASQELKATTNQGEKIGFPLQTIDLLNSSKNSGKNIMRARDMFIVGVSIPLALKFGASSVFMEGGLYPIGSENDEPFNTYEYAWNLFNEAFKSMDIPVEASWRDSTGMNAVKDLIQNRPDWLPLVYNCFSPECYKPERIKKWQRVAPTFPLYEHQCGSCVKCRELNIARIVYDPAILKATPEDVRAYIKDTCRWAREHKVDLGDILDGAFTEHLRLASDNFGVTSV